MPLKPRYRMVVPAAFSPKYGWNTQSAFCSSSRRSRTKPGRLGLPISSSPSTMKITFTGGLLPDARMASRQLRKPARQPLLLNVPRPTMHLPRSGSSTTSPLNGGTTHPDSVAGCTSYSS
ncbi:MAG: hypothetical protein BWY85_02057 [Firmicutes bacterium ADurb.Bin506]|nr:MAG: hypothetical protein BWY85_02057 [Firmicutes bacterium ADurb.Bin506]